MSFKFQTNRINTGASKSFSDLVSDYQNKKQASSKKSLVKTAEASEDEGPSSGQLEVEPLHQNSGKEEDSKESKDVKKAESEADEADSSGQTEWEGEDKNNNDPEAGEYHDEKMASEESATSKTKEANLDNLGDSKAKPFGKKDDSDEGKEDEDKTDKEDEDKECTAKDESVKFTKIANLDDKSKKWLKEFFSMIYMPEYADAMVADK